MIRNFINQLMLLVDCGKLLKSPIKWLYVLIGALNFVPFLAYLYVLYKEWNLVLDFLLPNFWGEFVTVFMLILFAYVLLIIGWALFVYWLNRKNNLDSVIETGSRTTAIPLLADVIQCSGEALSLYVVLVPTFGAILAFIACLLTDGYGFYSEYNFWWMLLAVIGGFIAVCIAGYINLLLTRFVAERIRLLAQIGNDVHKLSIGAPKEASREADLKTAMFDMPPITYAEKLTAIIAVAAAAVVALGVAVTLFVITNVMFNKPITEKLPDNQVVRLSYKYKHFLPMYGQVRLTYEFGSEEDLDKYKEVTYKRLYTFYSDYYENEEFKNNIKETAKINYETEIHIPALAKVKEEVAKWEQFKVDHDVNTYLIIDSHLGIETEKKGKKEYDRPSYFFTIEMPRGDIKDASVTYRPKSDEGKFSPAIASITTNLEGLTRYTEYAPAMYKSAKPELWDNYSLSTTINSVTFMDGTVIRPSDIRQIPRQITAYNENPTEKNELAVIYKFVDNNYPTVDEYADACVEKELEEKDALCYSFLNK